MRVVKGTGLEHCGEDPQQPITHAAKGEAVRVATSPVLGVGGGAPLIMLDADAGPMIDRLPERPLHAWRITTCLRLPLWRVTGAMPVWARRAG